MKINYYLIIIIPFIIFSCNNDPLEPDYFAEMEMGDEKFIPQTISAFKTNFGFEIFLEGEGTVLTIRTSNATAKDFIIGNVKTEDKGAYAGVFIKKNENEFLGISGTLQITSVNEKKIKGKLNLEAYCQSTDETLKITGGSFISLLDTKEVICLLERELDYYSDNTIPDTVEYSYDISNRLTKKKYSATFYYEYEYDESGRLSKTICYNKLNDYNPENIRFYETFIWTEGMLTTYTYIAQHDGTYYEEKYDIQLDGEGKATLLQGYYKDDFGNWNKSTSYSTREWKDGNLETIQFWRTSKKINHKFSSLAIQKKERDVLNQLSLKHLLDQKSYYHKYTYDSKTNKYSSVDDIYYIGLSLNNPTNYSKYNETGKLTGEYNYQYEYNQNGYPAKEISTREADELNEKSVHTIYYKYEYRTIN